MTSSNLISADELSRVIDQPGLRVLDCSWYLPNQSRDAFEEFKNRRVKGAAFFDIDLVSDRDSELPHMLPSAENFAAALSDMSISNSSNVVVYDSAGLFSAARVWWMFKVFGHDNVTILNGGLPAWLKSGGVTDSGRIEPLQTLENQYKATLNETFLTTHDVLKKNCETGEYLVLDARSKKRFNGEAPEPRPGLASGHMPQSRSLPYDLLIEDGMLKSVDGLWSVFREYGLGSPEASDSIVTSCGSGITAALITLALSEVGLGMHKLYDGAWAEWASLEDTVILTSV